MDIPALQRRLRHFAAERDWQPYQTPKNLAMAMTVEAAELLEIFQWLTPEQSQALGEDQRRHLGEELSDVLLYLVQIADHAGVDLDAAVERKLAMNALKHPPKHASAKP
ncbi:nucleotide pyrophosphohydrolase [Roseateles sp.]|jgi:NTP pyrophosphatase (non-canonical NTP hydrolase)|uniref:nucleotide pyrophosphohydrolase n=1 Tax=Roseateles sp. TaxID=1971397 RepID=UPI003BA99F56